MCALHWFHCWIPFQGNEIWTADWTLRIHSRSYHFFFQFIWFFFKTQNKWLHIYIILVVRLILLLFISIYLIFFVCLSNVDALQMVVHLLGTDHRVNGWEMDNFFCFDDGPEFQLLNFYFVSIFSCFPFISHSFCYGCLVIWLWCQQFNIRKFVF